MVQAKSVERFLGLHGDDTRRNQLEILIGSVTKTFRSARTEWWRGLLGICSEGSFDLRQAQETMRPFFMGAWYSFFRRAFQQPRRRL